VSRLSSHSSALFRAMASYFDKTKVKYTHNLNLLLLNFSINTEWVKRCIVSFKRHLNYLSIDAKSLQEESSNYE